MFATDLHGRTGRYEKLFHAIESESPRGVFLGGDLLPHFMRGADAPDDFLGEFVTPRLESLRTAMADRWTDAKEFAAKPLRNVGLPGCMLPEFIILH